MARQNHSDDFKSHYSIVSSRSHLFKPLGWTAPSNKSRYKLLGTKVVGDDVETGTWAYMSRDNNWSIVTVIKEGVSFDGSVVKEITARKVLLENGETYELGAVAFISPEGAEGRATRRNRVSKGQANRSSREISEGGQSQRKVDGSAEKTGRAQRRSTSASQRQRWQERIKAFQKATPEEQVRMIQQFRRGRR